MNDYESISQNGQGFKEARIADIDDLGQRQYK